MQGDLAARVEPPTDDHRDIARRTFTGFDFGEATPRFADQAHDFG